MITIITATDSTGDSFLVQKDAETSAVDDTDAQYAASIRLEDGTHISLCANVTRAEAFAVFCKAIMDDHVQN